MSLRPQVDIENYFKSTTKSVTYSKTRDKETNEEDN